MARAEVKLVGKIIRDTTGGGAFFLVKVGKSDALRKVYVTEEQMLELAESALSMIRRDRKRG